jgi:hypothetical protein
MGKQEIFEEIDYLSDLLEFYKVYKDPEKHEELINQVLDRISYLKKLIEHYD